MEHFTQEDVDRMIQEAAQAAKNKKGSGESAAKPAGAKPVSSGAVPPKQNVDPVEEVLASMNQDSAETQKKTEEKPPEAQKTPSAAKPEPEPETAVKEPVEKPEAAVSDPVEDVPEKPKPETNEKIDTPQAAEPKEIPQEEPADAQEPIVEPVVEPIAEPVEEPAEQAQQDKPQEQETTPPEPINEEVQVKKEEPVQTAQPVEPEPQPQPVKSEETKKETNIDPAFAALSSEQIYTFVMELIKDLSDAKVELAKMQVDLEIERLKNQASSFFKK